MQYIFMNKELKFLEIVSAVTHTGQKTEINWVSKEYASIFSSNNLNCALKQALPFRCPEIQKIIKDVIGIFEVKVTRNVDILPGSQEVLTIHEEIKCTHPREAISSDVFSDTCRYCGMYWERI